MNVVINALSARLGGGQTYVKNLLQRLPDDALKVYIYAPRDLQLPDDSRIEHRVPRFIGNNPVVRGFWERWILPSQLRKLEADVLFCPGGLLNTRVPAGCRTVTMFRNMIPFDERVLSELPFGLPKLKFRLFKRMTLRSMARADLVIFIAQATRQVIEQYISVKRGVTIPHGISTHFRQGQQNRELAQQLFGSADYLLYVSRFESYKHHFEVVSAYAQLSDAVRARYKLVLVGENEGVYGDRVRDLITHSGLQDRVCLFGKMAYQELPTIYRTAKLNLFVSSCENCPNILLEALAAGRPIVCAQTMPMPEFGGAAVVYVDPYRSQDIAQAMMQILASAEDERQLAAKALAQSQKFDWQETARQTWNELFRLTDKGAGRE